MKRLIGVLLCITAALYSSQSYAVVNVTTNTAWTTNQTINDDVVVSNNATLTISSSAVVNVSGEISVECGSTLTINGATLKIGDQIIVKADYTNPSTSLVGGRLNLYNGALITRFNTNIHWGGIEVWGVSSKPQSSATMGVAYIENSTIDGASVAIGNHKDITSTGVPATAGGLIIALGSTFKNNGICVLLKFYKNIANGALKNDYCKFSSCTFLLDDANYAVFEPGGQGRWFVDLDGVEGVLFAGCTFDNQETVSAVGEAIKARDAGFSVKDYCTYGMGGWYGAGCLGGSPVQSVFNNCSGGISAYGYFGFHKVYIGHAIFTNMNSTSIFIHNLMKCDVVGNTITSPAGKHGIVLDGCSGFRVEDNEISTSGTSGNPMVPGVGITISNSGTSYNDVYHNEITNFDYALEAVGQNRNAGLVLPSGLKFLCNEVISNYDSYDMIAAPLYYPTIFTQPVTSTTGINYHQASGALFGSLKAAGNFFDSKSVGTTKHIHNVGQPLNYYYSTNDAKEEPVYISSGVSKGTISSTSCVSRYERISTPTDKPAQTAKLPGIKGDIDDAVLLDDAEAAEYLNEEYRRIVDTLLFQYMWQDTTQTPLDSMAMVLDVTDLDYDYRIQLARIYAALDDYGAALEVLGAIEGLFTLDEAEAGRIANLISVVEVYQWLSENEWDWENMDGELKTLIEEIAENDDYLAGINARILLARFEDVDYDPVFVYVAPPPGGGDDDRRIDITQNDVKIFPNPAKDQLNIMSTQAGVITIIDLTGRTLKSAEFEEGRSGIDIRDLAPGIYFVKVYLNGNVALAEKLIKN